MTPLTPGSDPLAELRSLMEEGRLGEVLAWDREQGESAQPDAALLVATAATRMGEFGLAQTRAEAALAAFEERADRDGALQCHNLLGAIAFEQGRLAAAGNCFTRALDMASADGDNLMVARASNNLAAITHLRGEEQQSLSLYRTALLAYQRLGDQRGQAET